jgi:hypothetical protein
VPSNLGIRILRKRAGGRRGVDIQAPVDEAATFEDLDD